MKLLTLIGSYIKTHIAATAVVSTVVVGGVIATPAIIENVKEPEVQIKAQDEQEMTCAEGFELVNGNCTEIEQEKPEEVIDEPKIEESKQNENKTNSNKTESKPKIENKVETKSNNTTKPQENKPTCNDISCKITESNRVVYYDGKMLFGIKVYQPYGYDVDGWQYNSLLIQSLSKEDRTYVFNNYFKKETYCGTNYRTSTNCLTYSSQEEQLDDIVKTSEDEIYYNNDLGIRNYTACLNYLKNGTLYDDNNKDEMDDMCHQKDTEKFKWTVEDVQVRLDKNKNLKNLHTNVINESKGYKQAYQATRSLLQQ